MHYSELPTPALTIDLNILDRNLDRMARYCGQHNVGLRPHTKTHKTTEIARMQLDRGAVGLTVAKTGEAEVMAGAGLDDILLAFPVLGQEAVRRLANLTVGRRLLISLDNEITAQALSDAMAELDAESSLGVLVEFDAGLGRCGLPPGPALVELAQKIEKMPRLLFEGLMSFFGNVWGPEEERKKSVKQVAERVEISLEAFRKARMPVKIVSGGSTPSAAFAHEIPGLTEIRPGTYVFNDLNTFYQGACKIEDCAVRVVTRVVSNAVSGRAMVDAGSKALSSDCLLSGPKTGHGLVTENPDIRLIGLSEEHGHLDVTNVARKLRVGDVLSIIPNHVCTCVNMHDDVFLLRNGEVVGSWRIAARGKIR